MHNITLHSQYTSLHHTASPCEGATRIIPSRHYIHPSIQKWGRPTFLTNHISPPYHTCPLHFIHRLVRLIKVGTRMIPLYHYITQWISDLGTRIFFHVCHLKYTLENMYCLPTLRRSFKKSIFNGRNKRKQKRSFKQTPVSHLPHCISSLVRERHIGLYLKIKNS